MSNLWKALRDVSRDSDPSVGFESALVSEASGPPAPPSSPNSPGAAPAPRHSQLQPPASRQAVPGQPAARPRTNGTSGRADAAPATGNGNGNGNSNSNGKPRLAPLESPLRRRVGGTSIPLDKPRSPIGAGNAPSAQSGISPSAQPGTTPSAQPAPRLPVAPRAARASLLDAIRQPSPATPHGPASIRQPSPATPHGPASISAHGPASTSAHGPAPASPQGPAAGAVATPDRVAATPAVAAPARVAVPANPAVPAAPSFPSQSFPAPSYPTPAPVAAPLRPFNGAAGYRSYGAAAESVATPQWKPGDDDVLPVGGRKAAHRPRLKDRLSW